MNKLRKAIFIIILSVLALLTILCLFVGKNGVGRAIDKIGLTKDSYEVKIDNEFLDRIFIYWYGETVKGPKDNRILFYHLGQEAPIPPAYGINGFEIQYKGLSYDKINFWKMFSYSKYKYYINIKSHKDNMIIEWRIHNWYDPEIKEGSDTIKINQ